jgi:tetratricopeptide (TPR) repeat protein
MLVLETPLDAYRSDLARNKSRPDFGGADTVWLLSAHCLSRLSRTSLEDREIVANQCAAALRDFLDPEGGIPLPLDRDARDLELVVDGFGRIMGRHGADALSRGIRGMASGMADAGALSMAYTTLAHARAVLTGAADRERGLLAADQAKIARLLGDLESAEALYQEVAAIGEKSADFALLARACIGRGVINRVRGNYPRARIFFERALELAETAQSAELRLLAHQGITICLAIGRDFDRALPHAWATFELAGGEPAHETEALANLAQLCLDAGYPRAALQGFAAVLARTDVLRVCLGVLGGAAVAAARCGGDHVLERVAAEAEQRILRSALPYENAQALFHLAVAFRHVGAMERSQEYVARVRRLAKARGFFELLHAIETGELAGAHQQDVAAHELSESSQTVVESLTNLDLGDTAEMLALSR